MIPAFRPRVTPKLLCPTCGGSVPEDTIWVARGVFYCQEKCVPEGVKPGGI